MQIVKVRSRVGEDGILHLDVPVGVTDAELEVTMTIQPVTPPAVKPPEELGWEPGFIERTYGSCADDPIVIDDEGISEELDDDEEQLRMSENEEERELLQDTEKKRNVKAAIEGLRLLRQEIALKGLSAREMIEEGRRF